jgi:hypothetical protein
MSEILQQIENSLPEIRTVCLPKRVVWNFMTFAPLVSFIFSIVTFPGHVILFPYYLLAIIARGRPPRFLYKWVYFHSAFLWGAVHEKDRIWQDFWCLYFVYAGFIVAFINWILSVVSVSLIFPIFIFIEEWRMFARMNYRLTFGNWKRLVNDCPEMMRKGRKSETEKEILDTVKQHRKKKEKRIHDVEIVDAKQKQSRAVCPVCGVAIDESTTYCPKCGSFVGQQ